jgi:hypothetical protein
MKTNKKIKLIALFAVLIGLMSCSDFLEEEPIDVIVAENFYTNEGQILQGLAGIYDNLQNRNGGYDLGIWQLVDGGSDDLQGNTGAQDISFYAYNPTTGRLEDVWRNLYDGIYRANLLIENLGNAEGIDSAVQLRYEGEAKFLRALFYFHLVNLWGGVPLVDSVLGSSNLEVPKNTPAEIYAFIEDDLNFAVDHLPSESQIDSKGRASAGAATALLAKVFLFQEKWTEAAETADNIIISDEYQLLDDFATIFPKENENNPEIIFEVKFANIPGEFQLFSQWLEPQGWGQSRPTNNLLEAFEEGDERMNLSVINTGDVIVSPGFTVRPNDYTLQEGEALDPDFLNRIGSDGFDRPWWGPKVWTRDGWLDIVPADQNQLNIPVLRFSEVILIKAEALAENGDLGGAITELNKVRNRANLPDAETVINPGSQAEVIDLIRNDRRIELINEGHRLYDLRRWGIVIEALQAVEKPAVSPRDLLFPIPQREIDLHNGALQQNPGWN